MYISDYWDGNTVMVANFDEDIDFSTTTLKGGRLTGKALKAWIEEKVKMKYVDGLHRAVRLDWDRATTNKVPNYGVLLSDIEIDTKGSDYIVFSMADREEKKVGRKETTTRSVCTGRGSQRQYSKLAIKQCYLLVANA